MRPSATLDLSAPARFGVEIRRAAPLAGLTTMKVGGPAEYMAVPGTVDQLIRTVRWAREVGLPYFVLGGGSNLLISDAGIRGLVIHNRCRVVRVDPAPCCVFPQDERPYLFVESGAATAGAARVSVREGLAGLEWAVSVPGTMGGAIVGNAGAYGGEVKDSLESVLLLDEAGDIVETKLDELDYAYRSSSLKRRKLLRAGFHPVVLSANFRLTPTETDEERAVIRERANGYLEHRRRTQPAEPSLGSTFMNPPDDYAGRLIEAAGLKGRRMGGVEVSAIHANFIINPGGVGGATAADVLGLVELIEETVLRQFGIVLVREIQLAGEW